MRKGITMKKLSAMLLCAFMPAALSGSQIPVGHTASLNRQQVAL